MGRERRLLSGPNVASGKNKPRKEVPGVHEPAGGEHMRE
jgi:hypothetical protein